VVASVLRIVAPLAPLICLRLNSATPYPAAVLHRIDAAPNPLAICAADLSGPSGRVVRNARLLVASWFRGSLVCTGAIPAPRGITRIGWDHRSIREFTTTRTWSIRPPTQSHGLNDPSPSLRPSD